MDGEKHLARTRHSSGHIQAAIEKIRRERTSANITIKDLAHIVNAMADTLPEENNEEGDFKYSSESDHIDVERQPLCIIHDNYPSSKKMMYSLQMQLLYM